MRIVLVLFLFLCSELHAHNLSFGLSSSDSEEFATQILGFSGEVNGQGPFTSQKSTRDASKLPECEGEKPKIQVHMHVLVSIAPQKYLVERIGGDRVFVEVIVPPGANSHTYEPSTKQMLLSAQKGKIWFRIGESFENRILSVFNKTHILDQREGLDLIKAGCGCCTRDAHDPHIWLSPRLLKIQAAQITRTLCEHDPEYQELFKQNCALLDSDLTQLDRECTALFMKQTQNLILVSHPAFGYFCKDYGLEQLSIEMEGREPTPKYVTNLIAKARSRGVKIVFLQLQHNPKGGKRIAEELGAKTVYIDPYVENVLQNIRDIAGWFSQS